MEKKTESQRSLSPNVARDTNRRSFSPQLLRRGDFTEEEDPRPSSSFTFSESERCSSAQSDTSSWMEEGEGSRRGWVLLERLTEGLYSDQRLPGQLGEECELWRKNFPHFRVEGHAMALPPPGSLQSRPDSPTAEEEQVFASHGHAPAPCP